MSPGLPVASTIFFTLAFLGAEARGSERLRWIAKPLASASFVAVAVTAGALETGVGQVLTGALLLSFFGDVFLLPHARGWLLAGIGSFLLGHLTFAAAFLLRGVSAPAALGALVVLLPAALAALSWLRPHVSGAMRKAVVAYVAVITAMVVLAVGTVAAHGGPLLLAAAVAFFLSDLAVARDRFVRHALVNRAWGLPLYYGAQILFALSAAHG